MCKMPIYRLGSHFRSPQPGEISLLETYITAVASQELLLLYQPPAAIQAQCSLAQRLS